MNEGGGAGAGGSSSSSGAGASATKPQQQQLPSTTTASDGRSAQPALHLSSDEVNYLIYRYMQESGFVHSSFTFIYESMLGRSNMRISERSIPPGALVSFLQKGLQYVGIEETLQREQQQRGNATNSNKKNKASNSNNNGGNASLAPGGSSVSPDAMNLSLLSPTTINAMTRENPPLHLNVPAATAAAAVRARLEAEAQIEADRKKVAILEAREKAEAEAQSNGKRLTGPQSIPPQASVTVTNPLTVANSAHAAMDAQAQAQAQATHDAVVNAIHLLPQNSALSQHHQQQQQQQPPPPQPQQSKSAADSAANAALLVQRRVADIAGLGDHRHAQMQQLQIQILQEQEKLQLQKLRQETSNAAAQAQARGHNPMEAMSQAAAIAEQMGNKVKNIINNSNGNSNSNSNSISNNNSNAVTGSLSSNSNSNSNKRPSSAKKGPKKKGKSAKQQKTTHSQQQQPQQPPASIQGESAVDASASLLAPAQNSGIASLGEAVALLDARKASSESGGEAAKHQQQFQHHHHQQQPTKVVSMSDVIQQQPSESEYVLSSGVIPNTAGGGGEEDNLHPQDNIDALHQRPPSRQLPPHHPEPTTNILNHIRPELPSQHYAVQMTSMNGKVFRGERQNYNGSSEQPPQQPHQQQSQSQPKPQPPPAPASTLGPPIIQFVPSSASAQQQQGSQATTTLLPPKEAAKQLDALIDKEDEATNAKPSEVLELKNHESEVFMCAWNSVYTDMIATGSGDASARIWQVNGPCAADGLGQVQFLPHGVNPRDRKNKDVTTLEWSSDGKLLATGSYDGVARVWSLKGSLVHTLRGHKGPIFSLKWNKKGNYLLSGSYDKTTIVWDVSMGSGYIKQQFDDHQAPALDVDWKDDNTFASCSTDKTVHICRVGSNRPLKTYTGHTDEVNAVKWDPSGRLLASCSDDCTAKVWNVDHDRTDPLYDFKSHQQEIYTVKWAPTGPGSKNPDKKPLLATASFDGSVRLWNVLNGTCIQVFSRHRDSVYSVAFSPSGNFLASGSLAGQLYIWNVVAGRHIKSFKGKGDIFEVAWNKEETRVAACFSSNVVCILDFP
mmetsp:Transcript_13340/g.37558  ORF Transcript_13340/g.37558 Transcript_13340/m.37558 type:complete len:1067 (-) Transcript_13340:1264-4464(-)